MSILTGAQCSGLRAAAFAYLLERISVIPLMGKKPALPSWAYYQHQRARSNDLMYWDTSGCLKNIGIVCGKVSENLVVIDLDGAEAVRLWSERFSGAVGNNTFTVTTPGGGAHVYLYCEQLPANRKVILGANHSAIEIRGEGLYVVAPPSIHPDTGKPYQIRVHKPAMRVQSFEDINAWLDTLDVAKALNLRPSKPTEKPNMGVRGGKLYLRGRDGKPHEIRYPRAYARSALDNEANRVSAAPHGQRNNTLHVAAVRMGQLMVHGLLSGWEVENTLFQATRRWMSSQQSDNEILKTIRSGMEDGKLLPQGDMRS